MVNISEEMSQETKEDFFKLAKLVEMTTPLDPAVFDHLGVLKEIAQRHTVDA